MTVPRSALGPQLGYLLPAQEAALTAAIRAAFDLDQARRGTLARLITDVMALAAGCSLETRDGGEHPETDDGVEHPEASESAEGAA